MEDRDEKNKPVNIEHLTLNIYSYETNQFITIMSFHPVRYHAPFQSRMQGG